MWAAFRTKKVSRSAGALTPMDWIVRTISSLRADDVLAISLDMRNITVIQMAISINEIIILFWRLMKCLVSRKYITAIHFL